MSAKGRPERELAPKGRSVSTRERGVVLLIALVTSIALAYATITLVRATAVAVRAGDNVHVRRQAMLAAFAAVEHDVAAIFRDRVVDQLRDAPAQSYYASRQAGEDARGVPLALQALASYPAGAGILDVGDAHRVRHLVERLCALPGDATAENCTLSPPSVDAARGAPPPGEPPRQPSFRLTIRVDGTAGAATYAQAILSASHANVRLSWRVMDE